MSKPSEPDLTWDRVAAELRACRDVERAAWGGIDNTMLGRYLADEVTREERQEIEQALRTLPELRMLTDLVRDVLTDFEPVHVPTAPGTLSFVEHATRRAASLPAKSKTYFGKTFRQRTALAAAACLLLGLGLCLPGLLPSRPSRSEIVALGPPMATRDTPPGQVALLAMPPEIAPLAKFDREVDELETKGQIAQAIAKARELPALAKNARLDNHPRYTQSLQRVGQLYQKCGDLPTAVTNYARAHDICKDKLGPEHPATLESETLLANAYQFAINQVSAAPAPYQITSTTPLPQESHRLPEPAGVAVKMVENKSLKDAAATLGGQIVQQNARAVKQVYVPVLVRAMKRAGKVEERLAYIRALGRLGPAGRDAVPALSERMSTSHDAVEQQAIVAALGEMGPSAENALPVLAESLKNSDLAVRNTASESMLRHGPEGLTVLSDLQDRGEPRQQQQARDALRHSRVRQEACAGIKDCCDLFSIQAVIQSQRELLALVRRNGPALFIRTTMNRDGKTSSEADRCCCKMLDSVEGVALVLGREGQVEIRVADALRHRGFTLDKQTELKNLLENHLKAGNCDAALRECIQFVTKLKLRTASK